STHTRMKTRLNGSLFAALLRRFFGQESFFINEFSCDANANAPAELVLSQSTPGDIVQVDLRGNTLYLQPGAFIACGPGVRLGVGWAGFRSWFNGAGLFRLNVSGHGPLWMGAYGGSFWPG